MGSPATNQVTVETAEFAPGTSPPQFLPVSERFTLVVVCDWPAGGEAEPI